MKIAVGMSGGVDSSVAALKLRQEGHEIIGVTMKTWPKEDCGREGDRICCSLEAVQYARSVAEDLGIPHYVVDFSQAFSSEVRDYFVREYSLGRTPNPCIYCNRSLKFGLLMKKARELGMDALATGHYARIVRIGEELFLKEAIETRKDQSYFLCGIPKNEMKNIIFPLGEMTKLEVRKLARDNNLMSADRRSSQDICFTLPGTDYREYMESKGFSGFSPGDMLDTNGKVIGKHRGVASYTVGQRRGLGLGIHFRLYVVNIDPKNNTVTVGHREKAMKTVIKVKVFNWLSSTGLAKGDNYGVRIRYNGGKGEALVSEFLNGIATIKFSEKQFAPTSGQAAVFYSQDAVAGAGWIEEAF